MKFKLKPEEARAKWVESLRSGEYRQGTHSLRDNVGGFCCLGVACDLFRKEEGVGEWDEDRNFYTGSERVHGVLPCLVRDWLGLREEMGHYGQAGSGTALYIDNDRGKSFAEIADIIESAPEGLLAEAE